MPASPDFPAHEDIVLELRVLRERGLGRLRHTDLPLLRQIADRSIAGAAAGGGHGGVEALLRAAVAKLRGTEFGSAAEATFGLTAGTRGKPAPVRRRAAAYACNVSVDRFRKHHEGLVLEQVAEEILKLASARTTAADPQLSPPDAASHTVLHGRIGDVAVTVVVHVELVELISDIDIVVAPTNVYLEPPQHYKSSVSAAVRRAAAIRTADGRIVRDVVADEIHSWMAAHGRTGLPVAPGTVVPTSAGHMLEQRVYRIYHVAVAAPRPGTNDYDVEPSAIATGVRNVLAKARGECELSDPPLRSIAFPLLGAGRGGLDPAVSFDWMWPSLARDIGDNGPWQVHFISRNRAVAAVIIGKLAGAGFLPDQREPG